MHFMMDLETLGKVPGCVILSVGIVPFNPHAEVIEKLLLDDGYYSVVGTASCEDAYLTTDPDTERWWSKQTHEARRVIEEAAGPDAPTLQDAVNGAVEYVTSHCPDPKEIRMWGNGSDFDNGIFNAAADAAKVKLPWGFGGRCYRTLKTLDELLGPPFAAPPIKRTGTYHNALNDAQSQAIHMWQTLGRMRATMKRLSNAAS